MYFFVQQNKQNKQNKQYNFIVVITKCNHCLQIVTINRNKLLFR